MRTIVYVPRRMLVASNYHETSECDERVAAFELVMSFGIGASVAMENNIVTVVSSFWPAESATGALRG